MDAKELVEKLEEARRKVAPKLPDMDPGDLVMILVSLLKPLGSGRRYFLHRTEDGRHVF